MSKIKSSRTEAELLFLKTIQVFQYDKKEIWSLRRTSEIVKKRKRIAMTMRREGFSYPAIGHAMKRDHATVMNLITPKKQGRKAV